MITKDGRDTRIDKLTAENYIVPAGEERFYHAVIEVVQYNPKTGQKISKPRVQKFGQKMFNSVVLPSLRKQGYEVTILHDPTEWIKAHRVKVAESAKAAAAAKAKAEQERFDAAVAAAVAKELAKIQAANGEKPKRERAEKKDE